MLQNETFPVEFSGGIDTKTDEKHVVPGKLLKLENGVFTKLKKIQKRFGYDNLGSKLPGGTSLSSSQGISDFDGELVQFSNNSLYSYSKQSKSWFKKGSTYPTSTSVTNIARDSNQYFSMGMASTGNITAYVYKGIDSTGYVSVTDNVTGNILLNKSSLSFVDDIKCISFLGYIIIVFTTAGSLYATKITATNPTVVPSPLLLETNAINGSGSYISVSAVDSASFVIAYSCTIGGSSINIFYAKLDNVTGNIIVAGPSTGYPGITNISKPADLALKILVDVNKTSSDIFPNNSIWVFYSSSANGLQYRVLASDFTVLFSEHNIDVANKPVRISPILTSSGSSQSATILCEVSASIGINHFIEKTEVAAGSDALIQSKKYRSLSLVSDMFSINGENFVMAIYDDGTQVNSVTPPGLQSTYFLMKSDGTIISKSLPGQASTMTLTTTPGSILPSVSVVVSGSSVSVPVSVQTRVIANNIQGKTYVSTGISNISINLNNTESLSAKEFCGNLLISGGLVKNYDGAIVTEQGFNIYPADISGGGSAQSGTVTLNAVTRTGALGANLKYQYQVTYEWTDNKGQIHRSFPSVPTTVDTTGIANPYTKLIIPTLRVTEKNNVSIYIYRNTPSIGGSVFYKVNPVSPISNSTTVDSVTFYDMGGYIGIDDGVHTAAFVGYSSSISTDSTIQNNEILYTNGGVLENEAPVSSYILDVNKNRCIIAGGEYPLVFYYSKQSVVGEAPAFSSFLSFNVDPLGGPITGIKFLDDKIIVFKESYIFYVSGDGPNDLGQNNDFSQPIFVTSDVGCKYPKSIVLTPMGLMFMSNKGIYLLDRSLSVKYIGAEVEAYNSQNITSACLVENTNQVRFITDSGLALVYDYFFGQWSTFTNHEGVGSVFWRGNGYSYSRNSGEVFVENTTSYLDDTLAYPLTIRTSWLKLNGLQGFQRVRRALLVGDYLSSHTLSAKIAYDYEPYFTDYMTFDPAAAGIGTETYGTGSYGDDTTYGGATTAVYQFLMYPRQQKCEAIQFEFTDVDTTNSGPAYSISDLSLYCAIKTGSMKLPATKRVG